LSLKIDNLIQPLKYMYVINITMLYVDFYNTLALKPYTYV